MKKFKILLITLLFCSVYFISCNSGNNPPSQEDDPIKTPGVVVAKAFANSTYNYGASVGPLCAGSLVNLDLFLYNEMPEIVYGVTVTISSESEYISDLCINRNEYGNIESKTYKLSTSESMTDFEEVEQYVEKYNAASDKFQFYLYSSCPVNTEIPFSAEIKDLFGNSWTQSFSIKVELGKDIKEMVLITGKSELSDYYIGKYEVTQELYESVMGENPSKFLNDPEEKEYQNFRPVDTVSWYDAIYFCNKYSEMEGLTPCYSVNGNKNVNDWEYVPHTKSGFKGVIDCNFNANGYRLPTTLEWTSVDGDYSSYYHRLNDYAWYDSNSNSKTHEVGMKKSNYYGLYDMHGNVSEWVWGLDSWLIYIADSNYQSYQSYLSKNNNVHDTDGYKAYASNGFRIARSAVENANDPVIIEQPECKTVFLDETVELKVLAESIDGGTLSYQWYSANDKESDGIIIPDATSATYVPDTGTNETTFYYCEIVNTINDNGDEGNKSAAVQSEKISIEVILPQAVITEQPVCATVLNGENVELKVTAESPNGGILSYQWYTTGNINQIGSIIPDATEATYIPDTQITQKKFYYCEITNTFIGAKSEITYQTVLKSVVVYVYVFEMKTDLVLLRNEFYIGKYEVTQELYESVMGENPSYHKTDAADNEVQNNRPVENVSFAEAIRFCNKYSEMMGLTPCYSVNESTDLSTWSDGQTYGLCCNFNATGYRLPTDEEWKLAAQGGGYTTYTYSGSNDIFAVCWYQINSDSKTHEVGVKNCNGYGLYDMSGNVSEWVWDKRYNGDYEYRRLDHFYYGGDFESAASKCTVESSSISHVRSKNIGFRIARTAKESVMTPVITTQPSNNSNGVGSTVELKIKAESKDSGIITYQWYSAKNAESEGTEIIGANSEIYTPDTSVAGKKYYYCIATSSINDNGDGGQKAASVKSKVVYVKIIERDGNLIFINGDSEIPDFYIGKYEVTQKLYKEVMGENPSYFYIGADSGETQENRPVENISYYDAIYFCNKYSEMMRLTPCYSVNGSTDVSTWRYTPHNGESIVRDITCNYKANGFRLPNHLEWLYVANCGWDFNDSPYYYSGIYTLPSLGWYNENSNSKTHEVGLKKPNPFGVYDMNGNVSEMVFLNGWALGGNYSSSDSECQNSYSILLGESFDYHVRNRKIGFRLVRSFIE